MQSRSLVAVPVFERDTISFDPSIVSFQAEILSNLSFSQLSFVRSSTKMLHRVCRGA